MSEENKKFLKTRIDCKIGRLPDDVRAEVELMIVSPDIPLREISEWLKEEGHDISTSAVNRYAKRQQADLKRTKESLERARVVYKLCEDFPDLDYTKAARILALEGLTQRLMTSPEEFNDIPIEVAARLVDSLSRTENMIRKSNIANKEKIDLAFEELQAQMMETIKSDPKGAPKIKKALKELEALLKEDAQKNDPV